MCGNATDKRGIGTIAADLANDENTGSKHDGESASLNRTINLRRRQHRPPAISGSVPKLNIQNGNIDIGNNTTLNIGNNNNLALHKLHSYGLPGGFSNGVYNIGNRNQGLAGGVLSEPPSRSGTTTTRR